MPAVLVLLFVGVPLLEIWVILQVGAVIGGWPTFWLLVLDSLLGAWLLRLQGRRAWREFRQALTEARWPGDEVVQGALVLVGGTLLLTPGFVTDVVGFLLLVPPSRRVVSRMVRARMAVRAGLGGPGPTGASGSKRASRRSGLGVEVVEIHREQEPGRESVGPAGADSDRPSAGGGDVAGRGTDEGPDGPDGPDGRDGPDGPDGTRDGRDGPDGSADGSDASGEEFDGTGDGPGTGPAPHGGR